MQRTKTRFLASALPVAVLSALTGCSDEAGSHCRHRVCDITDPSCVDVVAEVVACQRDVPFLLPEVRFMTQAELVAERETPSAEQLEFERDYWAGEALVGLMPEGYDPANAVSDSLSGVLAQYRPSTEEIVIVSDSAIDDEATAYRVLVHELIHAHQDVDYDLEALWEQRATSFPRSLGLRAVVEGEAVLFTNLADLEIEGIDEERIDWDGYFRNWQDEMLASGRASQTPSLDVSGLFPYAFGGELVHRAWQVAGLRSVRDAVTNPPDSVRQAMGRLGYNRYDALNLDEEMAPHAVPVLPGYVYLSGGGQDAWLLNTMLQRIAGSDAPWASRVGMVEADHLSVWRDEVDGTRVAIWRLMGDTEMILEMLQDPWSEWSTDAAEATHYFMRTEGADWVLVASESDNAVEIADAITGWQSREDALATSELTRDATPRRLVLGHHAH